MHFAGERLAAPVLLAQIGQHTPERQLRLREIPGALTSCANARQNAYALYPSWEALQLRINKLAMGGTSWPFSMAARETHANQQPQKCSSNIQEHVAN